MTFHGVRPIQQEKDRSSSIFRTRMVVILIVISCIVAMTSSIGYYWMTAQDASLYGVYGPDSLQLDNTPGPWSRVLIAGIFGFLISALVIMAVFCILRMQLAGSIELFRKASGISPDDDRRIGLGCLNVFGRLDEDLGYLLKISENERRLRSVLDSVSDAVVTIDQTGIVQSFNSVAEKTFGYKADEVVGNNVSMLMPSPDRDNHDRYIQNYVATGKGSIIGTGRLVTGLRKDGSCFDLHLEVSEWKTDAGERLFSGIMWDVSEQRAAHAELEFRASYDQLTGVYNRSAGEERLNVEIIRAERYDCHLSIVMFDIDYFKQINDSHGHQRGDEVLIKLGSMITENIRETDIVSRWGGEEFLIILPETGLTGAELMAWKLRNIVEQTDFGLEKSVTISMGVTSYKSGDGAELMLRRADAALYQAKNKGRNCVQTIVDDDTEIEPDNEFEKIVLDNLED